jgi:hypothetical protein
MIGPSKAPSEMPTLNLNYMGKTDTMQMSNLRIEARVLGNNRGGRNS